MRGRLVEYATLNWVEEGRDAGASRFFLPHSVQYDDIYFAGRGLEETTHVFLKGNNLAERFTTPPPARTSQFSIAETGFGSGLNILAAWKLWDETPRPDHASLHFLSFEKHPFTAGDLAKAHAAWPELERYASLLRAQWPINIAGFHQLRLDRNVTLTLYFGDIIDGLTSLQGMRPFVDAWFLDGFAPTKNPAMWSQTVFNAMATLSRDRASCATFTVAGDVRRGLAAAGFIIEKRPGFGRKREMLCATYQQPDQPDTVQEPKTSNAHMYPWFSHATLKPLPAGASIAIIGGGIAGASLAYSVSAHGLTPILFEGEGLASGASGNPAGLIMPRLDRDANPAADFSVHAWAYTLRLLHQLQNNHTGVALFNPCGTARLASEAEQQQKLHALTEENLLPEGWIRKSNDGVLFPAGGVVSPPDFVRLLIADSQVIPETVTRIDSARNQAGDPQHTIITDTTRHHVDAVILANGLDALSFLQARGLPLTGSLGQIDVYPDAPAPEHAFSYGPYAAPLPERAHPQGLVIGATYRNLNGDMDEVAATRQATRENLTRLGRHRPDITQTLTPEAATSRARVRCVTPDRLPIAGPLPDWGYYAGAYDGLRTGRQEAYPPAHYQPAMFALTGLGSRGLVTAPLAAAMIASQLAGTPPPVPHAISAALHPARFFIRDLKRAKT